MTGPLEIERAARAMHAHECARAGLDEDEIEVRWRGLGSLERRDYIDLAQAALAALQPAPGMVMVPVEPTEEMLAKGNEAVGIFLWDNDALDNGAAKSCYRAMIQASKGNG